MNEQERRVSAMLEMGTQRLQIRESTADDLLALLPIYMSNPAFVEQNEGSEGEIGRYDLDRWQRDWYILTMMPGHHRLGCYLKAQLTPVGILDFLEENDDGYPWLGTLVIHSAYQRQGLGSEAFQCLAKYGHEQMAWTTLRAGVKAVNEVGLAFLAHLGFQIVEERKAQFASGFQKLFIMEHAMKQ
jgi:RimJ/RimL family protein N-acetyltransferase